VGTCFFHLNQRPEAERNAIAYTKARPQDARGWLLLGDVRAAKHDWAKAMDAFAAAKNAEPGSTPVAAQVSARQGQVDLALKDYPKAKEAFEDAVAKGRPDDPGVLLGLGRSYVATQQPRDKLLDVADRL